MSKNRNPRASGPKFMKAKKGKAGMMMAAAPADTLAPNGNPLAELPGTWIGSGFNMIAVPDFAAHGIPGTEKGGSPFRLIVNKTSETITFSDIGPVPNRGNIQPDIIYNGVQYLQQVSDAVTLEGLHVEPGLWLNLPANPVQTNASVARLSTIPHGDSLLAQGPWGEVDGGPIIDKADATPFTLDAKGNRVNDTNVDTYLKPYFDTPLPSGIPAGSILNPNLVLEQAIKDQEAQGRKITKTIFMQVNAAPIGGINGTPVSPEPGAEGGLVNIPFIVKNADANSMSSIFWIELVQNSDGSHFLQLQYTQTVILDFPVFNPATGGTIDIKWPHITVGTLIKR